MINQALGGLVAGGVYAALAVVIVLMYQMLGVLSFCQGAVGGLGACSSLYFFSTLGWGTLAATFAGVVCGAVVGFLLGLVMARFFLETSVETRSLVTIGFLVGIVAIGNRILDGATYSFPDPFAGRSVDIGDTGVPVGSLVEVAFALLLALGITVFVQRTYLGSQLRAMSERPITAQLLGVRVNFLTVAVWTFAGAVSTAVLMFILPTSTTSFPPLAYLIVNAMAAALFGLLRNLWIAALGGIFIGVMESVVEPTTIGRYTAAVPFVIIMVIMVYWRRKDVWSEAR